MQGSISEGIKHSVEKRWLQFVGLPLSLSIAISLISNFPVSSSNQRTATILKMYKQYLLTSQLESEVTLLITLHNLDND
jgi:hypothetical protein